VKVHSKNATKEASTTSDNFAEGREHLLLWFVSSGCSLPRQRFFHALQAALPPDSAHVYGACGKPSPCPGRDVKDSCHQALFSKYKFYAAFENSRCEGYITEKFYRGLDEGIVPVALGGKSREDYEALGAPPGSFLHVDDFRSVEALAEYMAGMSDATYNKFFVWRSTHEVQPPLVTTEHVLCDVCSELHKNAADQKPSASFGDLTKWFYDGNCVQSAPNWNAESIPSSNSVLQQNASALETSTALVNHRPESKTFVAERSKLHLLSFGAGHFKAAAERLADEARSTAVFDKIHIYDELPRSIITDPRWKTHLAAQRGYGYWFWKAALASTVFETMAYGDALVYMDAGCELGNASAWGNLLEHLCTHDLIAFSIHGNLSERKWTKGDIFARFGIEHCMAPYDLGQLAGTYWLLKKTPDSEQFLLFWQKLVADFHLVSDEPSVVPNDVTFSDNRHDQSLFSLLVKASSPLFEASPKQSWDLHKEFGIRNLQPLILDDFGYPPNTKKYAFAAARNPSAVRSGDSSTLKTCDESCLEAHRQLLSCSA